MEKKESLIARFGYVILLVGLMSFSVTIFVTFLVMFSWGNEINVRLFRAFIILQITRGIAVLGLLMHFLPRRIKSELDSK